MIFTITVLLLLSSYGFSLSNVPLSSCPYMFYAFLSLLLMLLAFNCFSLIFLASLVFESMKHTMPEFSFLLLMFCYCYYFLLLLLSLPNSLLVRANSNINEVLRAVLSSLFFFFFAKRFWMHQKHQKHKDATKQKYKNANKQISDFFLLRCF